MDSCLVQVTSFILRMYKEFHKGMILVDLQKLFDTVLNVRFQKTEYIGSHSLNVFSHNLSNGIFCDFSDTELINFGIP